MKASFVAIVGAASLGSVAGCDEFNTCIHAFDVHLPAGYFSGDATFNGAADGIQFLCRYHVSLEPFQEAYVQGSCSEGPVELRIDRDDPVARFRGAPSRVDYRLLFEQLGSTPGTSEGTFEPDYPDVECPIAEESVEPPH